MLLPLLPSIEPGQMRPPGRVHWKWPRHPGRHDPAHDTPIRIGRTSPLARRRRPLRPRRPYVHPPRARSTADALPPASRPPAPRPPAPRPPPRTRRLLRLRPRPVRAQPPPPPHPAPAQPPAPHRPPRTLQPSAPRPRPPRPAWLLPALHQTNPRSALKRVARCPHQPFPRIRVTRPSWSACRVVARRHRRQRCLGEPPPVAATVRRPRRPAGLCRPRRRRSRGPAARPARLQALRLPHG
jgi:hypothetical protein